MSDETTSPDNAASGAEHLQPLASSVMSNAVQIPDGAPLKDSDPITHQATEHGGDASKLDQTEGLIAPDKKFIRTEQAGSVQIDDTTADKLKVGPDSYEDRLAAVKDPVAQGADQAPIKEDVDSMDSLGNDARPLQEPVAGTKTVFVDQAHVAGKEITFRNGTQSAVVKVGVEQEVSEAIYNAMLNSAIPFTVK